MTNQQLYVDFNTKMNRLAGESYLGFSREEVEWYLNEAMYQYIGQILDVKKNRELEDVSDTKRENTNLESLLTKIELPIYKSTDECYSIVPSNFLHLETALLRVTDKCDEQEPVTSVETKKYFTVALPGIETLITWTLFATINGSATSVFQTAQITSSSVPSDLMYTLVARVLQYVNDTGLFEVYWESYNGIYVKNSFIFVYLGTGNLTAAASTVNGALTTPPINSFVLNKVTYAGNTVLKACSLQPMEDIGTVEDNPFTRSVRRNSTAYLFNGKILVKLTNFTASTLSLIYRRRPRVIDYKVNQAIELGSYFGTRYEASNAIVNIAVTNAAARLGNDNIQILNQLQ